MKLLNVETSGRKDTQWSIPPLFRQRQMMQAIKLTNRSSVDKGVKMWYFLGTWLGKLTLRKVEYVNKWKYPEHVYVISGVKFINDRHKRILALWYIRGEITYICTEVFALRNISAWQSPFKSVNSTVRFIDLIHKLFCQGRWKVSITLPPSYNWNILDISVKYQSKK